MKYLSVLLLLPAAIFSLSACTVADENISIDSEPIEAPEVEAPIADGRSTYSNEDLLISFEYPSEWGQVVIQEEPGYIPENGEVPYDEDGSILFSGTVNFFLSFDELGVGFAQIRDKDYSMLGRGAGHLDAVMNFESETYASNYCLEQKEGCIIWENQNGIQIYQTNNEQIEWFGVINNDVSSYGIVGNDSSLDAYFFSDINLDVSPENKLQFEELIQSIKFLK